MEILDAAFEEFSIRGFAGTRLDDVADRAGITKGTIYVYFGSKEDLFVAALKEKTRPVFDNLAALMTNLHGPATTILKSHLDFVAAHMVEDPCGRDVVRMLMAEGQRFPLVVDRWHAEVIAPALESIRAVIRYGTERGEFRPCAVEAFPQLILAPAMLAVNWLAMFGEHRPLDVAGYFAAAFDLFSAGLGAPHLGAARPAAGSRAGAVRHRS